jgi:hypothetical protein
MMNREFRKAANLPFGISTNPCSCCKKLEKRKHECTHEFCEPTCSKKKAEQHQVLSLPKDIQHHNALPLMFRRKLQSGVKPQIFGLVEKSKEEEKTNTNIEKTHSIEKPVKQEVKFMSTQPDKRPVFIVKK